MPIKTVRFYTLALIFSDIVAILAAFTLAYILRVQFDSRPLVNQIGAIDFFLIFLQFVPFWLITLWALGLYRPAVYQKRLLEYSKLLAAAGIGILLIIGFDYISEEPVFPARLVPIYAGIAVFFLLIIGRELLRLIRRLSYRFGYGIQRVMIVGSGDMTLDIIKNLADTKVSGYKVVATVGTSAPSKFISNFSSLDHAMSSLRKLRIHTIIHTEMYPDSEKNQKVMRASQANHIQYCFIPGEAEFYSGKNQIDVFLGYPMINVYQTPLVGWGELVKRIFDIFWIIISSPVWLPLFCLILLAQKIFNPGPLFFRSERLGLYGKKIYTLKLRSMIPKYSGPNAVKIFRNMGREDLVAEYEQNRKVKNDPRVTWFGRIIRSTSIDEFPQIFNVLKGEMSLVGPRPIIKEERVFYKDRAPLLFSVRPGLTGLWQVSGRSDLSFKERVELELYYAQNWSFWLDIKILIKTISVVLFRKGAH